MVHYHFLCCLRLSPREHSRLCTGAAPVVQLNSVLQAEYILGRLVNNERSFTGGARCLTSSHLQHLFSVTVGSSNNSGNHCIGGVSTGAMLPRRSAVSATTSNKQVMMNDGQTLLMNCLEHARIVLPNPSLSWIRRTPAVKLHSITVKPCCHPV